MERDDVEERLAMLESHVLVQEAVVVAMQAERIEAERLNDSVVRLGLGASDLGAALLQVDKNQQLLHQLGKDITHVEAVSATKDEVEYSRRAQMEKVAQARKEILIKATAVVVVLCIALVGLTWWAIGQQRMDKGRSYENCLAGKRTMEAVDFYLGKVRDTSTNPELASAAGDVVDSTVTPNCDLR